MEEGSSFWNQNLTWRTLFCAMVSTFTLNLLLSGFSEGSWGKFNSPGLVNFGSFTSDGLTGFTLVHLPFFLLMGLIGGCLGGLFNALNAKLTLLRLRVLKGRAWLRWLEALAVVLLTSVASFVLPYLFGYCGPATENLEDVNFFCPSGQFNHMASLFFTPQETAIRRLFHSKTDFHRLTLWTFFVFYFLLACVTYGVAVSSGIFVPSLLTGAAYGNLIGSILK